MQSEQQNKTCLILKTKAILKESVNIVVFVLLLLSRSFEC